VTADLRDLLSGKKPPPQSKSEDPQGGEREVVSAKEEAFDRLFSDASSKAERIEAFEELVHLLDAD